MVTLAPRKRIRVLAAILLAAVPAAVFAAVFAAVLVHAPAGAAQDRPAPALVVRRWLALDAVDRRDRVPFNANAVLARHLLDRAAPPPREGEKVQGDLAEAAWRPVAAKEDGAVEDESGAWFYGEVEGPKEPAESVFLAHLDGAATLFVNGAGFPGDVYRLGTGPVPVALRAGVNRLFVAGPRGPWALRFEPWPAGRSPLLREDATLPDVVEGERAFDAPASFRLVNPSTTWQSVGAEMEPAPPPPPGGRDGTPVPPLWTGKATERVSFSRGVGSKGPVKFGVRAWAGAEDFDAASFDLQRRKPGEARRITFVSRIDGTAQFYGYLPPAKGDLPQERIGLVLSLHGAGVDALDQARAYSPKPDFRIVAPTNRRPYGFDWQDWGRADAYEALGHAIRVFDVPRTRWYLAGHSMGGHGTWHLAANDPGLFAAIAPSAGWCSFDTYGGGPRPTTPLTPLWRGCDGGSRTEDLVTNLLTVPTYVLHGTKDDNVPLSEAEGMLQRIETAGGKPLHHFQEGAGHWWDGDAAPGADCVDWPGIFDLFRRSVLPVRERDLEDQVSPYDGPIGPDSIDWTKPSGDLPGTCHWVHVDQALEYGKPCRVRAARKGSVVEVLTENVRRLDVDSPAEGPVSRIVVDGTSVDVPEGFMCSHFTREAEGWVWNGGGRRHMESIAPSEKGFRQGPFKRAFDHGFVLVVGTKGTEEENRESMELARFHAATWWYRGNGNAPVVRDVDVLAAPKTFGNLVLYGNADTNAAWKAVVPASCPMKVRNGSLTLGTKEWKGDGLGAVLVHPRADDPDALVAAFASTGARGTRLGYGLSPFTSGVGYPEYAVYGEEFLRSGEGGVLAAGWFDHRWGLQPGGLLREGGK